MAEEQKKEIRTGTRFTYQTVESAMGNVGKVPPQAVDFEQAVLGALMLDRDAITNVVNSLQPDMFYKEQHQEIYRAAKMLFQENEPIDLLTISDWLRKEKKLESAGGLSYLASLTNKVASAANIEYHARIVRERYVLRQLINICGDISKKAYDDPKDVLELLDDAETDLFNIVDGNFSRESKELGVVVDQAMEEIIQIQQMDSGFNGVPTGIRAIDDKIGGWQNSDLVILAARPGMGKTSFVLSIARNAAIDFKKNVALFSLEMSSSQLAHRLFAIESGIAADRISKAKLDGREWEQLMSVMQVLKTDKLIIDDTPGLSIFDLRAKCRRLKHKYDIDLIIIDYLQLMTANSEGDRNRQGNREQEISLISRSLKGLAKDLNVPVIALSQLSRQVEQRGGDKRPQLSDLRESGSIEQDADQVLFIYRPEYYKMETFSDGTPSAGKAEIQIAKNRHGSTADVRVRFDAQFTKFADDVENDIFIDSATAGITPNTGEESATITIPASFNDDSETTSGVGDFPF